ncbi:MULTISPECIES: choice-of-anchor J domain-containing protein [unclassified Flavobacterium]|uniref:choice-of-anchor J domain-containing protein n=1 Tax=unclassified Flavobacterium TaxID=196869 RepID=UPI001F131577|nr:MULTISPECIES: choice-of-anchor J domain-containing protein [unclassified Flavobacterium]UMY65731.1 choice-of-anchor J domain-containing protein [Flavobacterium sp. HJ-32-4]
MTGRDAGLNDGIGHDVGSPPSTSVFRFARWLFGLAFLLFFSVGPASAQTTLISPTGDGGFANGSTFAANGWTASSSANNPWVVGTAVSTAPFSGNSAYISNDGGTTNAYTQANDATNYFYRDITVPAGETIITLSFNWRSNGESSWDLWQVFYAPTTVTPTGVASHPGSGTGVIPTGITGATLIGFGQIQTTVQTATFTLPASLAGTTFRLIFSWKNETGGSQPPAAIDNISMTSRAPMTITSNGAGGLWSSTATWVGGIVPTSADNAVIADGSTVTIDQTGQAVNNLTIGGGTSGILNYGTTPSTFTIVGNLTVNAGGAFNVYNGTAGKSVAVAGNITNNGTIDMSVGSTATALTLNGTTVQTVGGSGSFTANTLRGLTFNNTNAAVPNINWNFNNISIANTLTFTAGKVALGSNKLTLGINTTTTGTLSYTAGGFTGGTFNRYWTTAGTGSTITGGTDPSTATSRYPFVSATNQNRSAWIERSTSTVAGQLSCTYVDATGTTPVSVIDGAYTIESRYNGSWTFSTEGSAYSATNNEVALVAPGGYIALNSNSRILLASSSVGGTQQGGTSTPGAQRVLSVAQLTSGALYIGAANVDISQPCTGTPTPGTVAPASTTICANTSGTVLTATGFSTGVTGINFQWEESDDNGVADAWANAVGGSGATTASYTPPVLASTRYYRLRVTCSNSGLSDVTNVATITTVNCAYDVTRSTGITYNSIISTGNAFTWSTTSSSPAVNSSWQTDENTTTQVTFPFPFTYRGTTVTGFRATVNGFVTLSNTALSTQSSFTVGLGSTATWKSVIAPMWADLVIAGNPNTVSSLQGAGAPIKYQVDGTSPNRVLTVEWSNMETFNNAGPNLNFQVKFYETTNNIEFVYGSMEGYNGTADYTYSYASGLNGESIVTPSVANLTSQQLYNTRSFAATAVNNLNVVPECNSSVLFTPGDYTAYVPGSSTPANDEPAGAATLTVNASPCTSLCGTYYDTKGATASAGITACSVAGTTPDDDVWFKFTAGVATDYKIQVYGGGGYNAVVQLFSDAGTTAVSCVNATGTGLTETINATGLTTGVTYYIRVYHAGTGNGTATNLSICVSEVISPPTNDNIATATTLTPASSCTTTASEFPSTLAATASPTTPAACNTADDDVWYKFTATSLLMTVTVQSGSGYNAAMQILSSSDNTPTGTLTQVACVNATSSAGQESYSGTFVPGNTYFVRVYHAVSGAGSGNFTICVTDCATAGLPLAQGLNSGSLGCWSSTVVTDGTGSGGATPSLTYVTASTNPTGFSAEEGTGFYRFNSFDCDAGDQIRLVSQAVNTTGVSFVDVKFKWLHSLTYTNLDEVQVQYSLDGATWVNAGGPIVRYDGSTLGWIGKTVTLPAGAGNQPQVYIAFLFTGQFGNDCYIDDINIVETPPCAAPTNVVASAITNNSATISWDASVSTPANGYEYYFSTSSTTPTGATTPSGAVGAGILTAGISSLTGNTDYYVWVRSVCDALTTSDWSSVGTFTTACDAVTTFPWTEGFETTSTWLGCFSVIDNNADTETWTLSTSQPRTGARSAAMNSDFNSSNDDYLITPQLSLDATPKRLRFWVRANSAAEPDEISVRISTTGKTVANFTNVALASTPVASTTYTQLTVDLTAYANSNIYIAFVRNGAPADGWILYLDDILVEDQPSCIAPNAPVASNVTTNSATVSWTAPAVAPADGYEYYFSTSNTTPTNATTPSGSTAAGTTFTNLSLLSGSTQYYFWVRSVCSTGVSTSEWSSPASFYTGHCVPAPSSVDGLGITNVTMGTINNTTSSETGNYGDYSAQSTTAQQASTVSFSITYETGYTYDTAIFVDWNDDLDFSDSGETVYTGTSAGDDPTVLSGTFVVPLSASVGSHRLRIGGQDGGPVAPCYTGSFGTFEDYTINVTAAPICTGTPTAGTIPSSSAVCVGSTVQLVATGYTTGTGISFQWEESDDNGVGDAWADAVGGTGATTDTYTTPTTLSGTRYYRLKVTCATSAEFAYTNTNTIVASVCSFDVTRNTGVSYASIISTGNSFTWSTTSSTPAVNSSWQTDENTSTAVSFPFPFVYRGTVVSNFKAHVNGFVSLSDTPYTSHLAGPAIGSTSNYHSVVAPFWADLVTQGNPNTVASLQGASAPIKYQVDGTAPNRVLTVEWSNMETFLNAGPNLNFQVKFYETTNNIEFVYGSMEGFNGTTDYTYAYAAGMNGETIGTPNVNNLTAQQLANTRSFAATAVNNLNFVPDCNSSLLFTPGAYTTYVPGASTPANDEPGGAVSLTVNTSPCTSLCGTYYSTAGATASAGISACSPSAIGTPDDDVWFSFVATTADINIRVYGGGGYNPVAQLFSNAGTTSLSCINATGNGLTETLAATGLTVGATYYVRVYHLGTGNGTTPEISICVSEVITAPANDNIAGAVSLTVDTFCNPTNSPQPSVLAATLSPQTACTGTPDDDVWYSFVASSSYQVVTVQSGSGYNAVLQVFSSSDNTPTGTLTSLTCTNNTSTAGTETYASNTFVPGNTYYVRVYHFASGVGSGNFSVCVAAPSPVCVAAPTAPVNGSNSCVSGTGTTLSWAAVTNATNYDVYLDTVDGSTLVSNDQTATSYTTAAPLAGGTYFWRVVPLNANGEAGACSTFSFIKDPASVGGTISAGTSVCGTDRGTLTLSGHTGTIVRWESSVAPFTSWTPITNTTTSYAVGALSVPTRYRVVVQSGACSTATSAEINVDAVSTSWNGTTWSNGTPNSGMAAVIPVNFSATSDLAACSLTVNGGAVVTVGSVNATTNAITSAYDFDISGPVTVQSGSLTFEQGSNLLQTGYTGANSGNITVKTQVRIWRQDYVYWGSPVSGQKLNAFSPLTLWNRFYTFNPAGNAYAPVFANATDPALATYEFVPGTGYMVRAPNTFVNPNYAAPETQPWFTSQFTGVPNNGTVSVTTTNGVSNVHMISNPYPSTVNADATTGFLSVNPGTLYFWTHHDQTPGGNNYAMYNNLGGTAAYLGGAVPNGTIQVGQGFLFTNNNNLASVSFTNAMRVGNNEGQFFRTASGNRSRIWLNVANGTVKGNQMLVGYTEEATMGVDMSLDGILIPNGNCIASLIGNDRYGIQARPAFSADDIVPMGLRAETAGTFTVSLDHVDGVFEGDQDIFLKDNLTGVVTNLKQASYSFATEAGDFNDRLQLQYVNTTLGIPGFDANTVVIYKDDNQVLTINAGTIEMANVKIFDIRGRQVYTKEAISSNVAQLGDLKAEHQVLLVQITSADGRVVTKKVAY